MKRTLLVACLLAAPVVTATAHAQRSDFPLPVGYWSFDRCDVATVDEVAVFVAMDDTSTNRTLDDTNNTDAVLQSGAQCGEGWYGTGAYFPEGRAGRANIRDDNGKFRFVTQMTVAAWVKPTSVTGAHTVINKWYGGDSYVLSVQNGYFVFSVLDTSSK